MAHILNNPKYGEGHKVVLKDKLAVSADTQKEIMKYGYKPGQSVFVMTKRKQRPDIVIHLTDAKTHEYMIDEKKKCVLFYGSDSVFNATFNHFGKQGRSKTKETTTVKELISMCVFEQFMENGKTVDEDFVYDCLPRNLHEYYDKMYYESALKQLKALQLSFNKNFGSTKLRGYDYERQQDKLTKPMYKHANTLTKLLADNWNPGDVWMIKKGFSFDSILKSKTTAELNAQLKDAFKKKELIGISLKQVTTTAAREMTLNLDKAEDLNMDFGHKYAQITQTFNNCMVYTNSGFGARLGFKGGERVQTLSLEGRNEGAKSFAGAIDAKGYVAFVKEKYNYTLRNGNKVNLSLDESKALNEIKMIYSKYPPSKLSVKFKSLQEVMNAYKSADQNTKERFCNFASYLYSFLVLPDTPKKRKEHYTWCYFVSKKMTPAGGVYILISE